MGRPRADFRPGPPPLAECVFEILAELASQPQLEDLRRGEGEPGPLGLRGGAERNEADQLRAGDLHPAPRGLAPDSRNNLGQPALLPVLDVHAHLYGTCAAQLEPKRAYAREASSTVLAHQARDLSS